MPDSLRLHVQQVKDADTIVAEDADGDRVTVRVWGIDCPESAQPYGRKATAAARELVEGELATVEVRDTDRYGRVIGRVHAGDTDLGASLARSGYAWHSRRYPTSTRIKNAEQEARAAGRELWRQDDPVPPWHHRSGGRRVSGSELLKTLGWFLLGAIGLILLGALLASA